MNKKICILSIDGGGIRGIIPATIIRYIEESIQERTGEARARISDYFDLMAGTSTGGILVCAYLVPAAGDPMRPRFTAEEALNLYKERGGDIFELSLWQKIRTAKGTLDEKYQADALEKALDEYFGETKLSQLLKPCLIPAYDIENRMGKFFTSYNADANTRNFLVKDVARATSAAPTYFETAHIRSMYGVSYALIDGGVFVNNPALCAYAEARTMKFESKGIDYPTAKDMLLLSLGTGEVKKPYAYKDAKDWGSISWIKPLIDIMMSGNSETVDYQLKQLYDTLPPESKTCYKRIQVDLSKTHADPDMDNAGGKNIAALEEAGKRWITDHLKELDDIVDLLIANSAPAQPPIA